MKSRTSRGDVRRMLLSRGWTEPRHPLCEDPARRVTWYDLGGESSLVGGGVRETDGSRVRRPSDLDYWELRFYDDTPARVIVAAVLAVAEQEACRA